MSRPQLFLVALLLAGSALAKPQATSAKRNLVPSDYGKWQVLLGSRISNDGHWLAYGVATVDGDETMTLKNCDTPDRWETQGGANPRFSADSKWCAYMMIPPRAVQEQLRAEKKPIEPKLGIRDLVSGEEKIIDRVGAFKTLKYGPSLLVSRLRGVGKPEGGSDLEVLRPSIGYSLTIGNVVEALPNDAEDLILLQIHSDSGDQGVQLLDLKAGTLKTLAWGQDDVQGLAWADKADVAGFLLGKKDEKKEGPYYRAIIASNLRDPKPAIYTLDPATRKDFPKGKRITPYLGVDLSDDGNAIAFGVQVWNDVKKDERKPEDRSHVEVWNTHDLTVMPAQILNAQAERERSDLWVWRSKDDSMRRISEGEFQSAIPLGDFEHALMLDDKAYRSPITTGFDYGEMSLYDPWTKKKTVLDPKAHWVNSYVPSKSGDYVAYYSGKNWWLADVATSKTVNLTGSLAHTFEDPEDDHLAPEKPFASRAIWLKDDAGLVVGDEFDEFLARPGAPGITQLTDGRKDRQVYRLLDTDEDLKGVNLDGPFFYHVLDKDSKASGLASSDAKGKAKVLVLDNIEIGGLHKARDGDRYTFVMGSYAKSPDTYVTNAAFSAVKPESHTNPQQAQFNWGHTELVDYKSKWGEPLQGILVYPADYVKGKSYPMVTYIYERQSDALNQYRVPDPLDPYNVQIFSQTGYFVYLPDIAYRQKRTPGEDAVACLGPALDAVFAKNVGVDRAKVGLVGHSWGGYETAFVTTVSKMFACGVAGAPVTEMTSMYNSFYWKTGETDQELFESIQGRMGVPFWDDPKDYIDNSPVWQSRQRTTPLLFAAGTADEAVDWHQSLYLYNTLRRLGKDAVLLVYPGQNHSLSSRAARTDYSARVREYLGVYLKGEKAPDWITKGIPYIHSEDAP